MKKAISLILLITASFYFYGCSSCNCGGDLFEAKPDETVKLSAKKVDYEKDILRDVKVETVLDGGTLVLDDGEKVHLLNIELPEEGTNYWIEGRAWVKSRVEGKEVTILVCQKKPVDYDGYTNAYILRDPSGNVTLGEELLGLGLATVKVTPPCGIEKVSEYNRQVIRAKSKKLGIWGKVVAEQAELIAKERAKLKAQVDKWKKGSKQGQKIIEKRKAARAGSGPAAMLPFAPKDSSKTGAAKPTRRVTTSKPMEEKKPAEPAE